MANTKKVPHRMREVPDDADTAVRAAELSQRAVELVVKIAERLVQEVGPLMDSQRELVQRLSAREPCVADPRAATRRLPEGPWIH